ncbi:hypothetical protein [uncultured Tateyamaria sp.]|uniref:thioesterase family protein n=1 Tax=Tateyamaria sp. 1078 TaxID=3417464 RepID=UPI00261B0DCA|nr:hypothetical protein [uncultured Tateyamaria sp.]
MKQDLQIGQCHTLTSVAEPSRSAMALASQGEALPDVFATPFMIADMERACAALLDPLLNSNEVSVGARIEVSHTAPTPIGSAVSATATFTEHAGALYWFDVIAQDAAGQIGKGRIARAIVDRATLMSTAGARG